MQYQQQQQLHYSQQQQQQQQQYWWDSKYTQITIMVIATIINNNNKGYFYYYCYYYHYYYCYCYYYYYSGKQYKCSDLLPVFPSWLWCTVLHLVRPSHCKLLQHSTMITFKVKVRLELATVHLTIHLPLQATAMTNHLIQQSQSYAWLRSILQVCQCIVLQKASKLSLSCKSLYQCGLPTRHCSCRILACQFPWAIGAWAGMWASDKALIIADWWWWLW